MIIEDESPTAVVVSDTKQDQKSSTLIMRSALLRALSDSRVPTVITHTQELDKVYNSLRDASNVVVFTDSLRALKSVKKCFPVKMGWSFVLTVVPTAYSGWGKRTLTWSKGLSDECDRDTVILTDSQLSRRVLEKELATYRADVRILSPEWDDIENGELDPSSKWDSDLLQAQDGNADESKSNYWSFGLSKTAALSTNLPFGGLDWGFRPRNHSTLSNRRRPLRNTQNQPRSAANQISNASLVKRLMNEKTLAGAPRNIGILGTKLTFIDELGIDLARKSGSTVSFDEWEHLAAPPDPGHSQSLLDRSDVIIGEWARPNNVWIQERAQKDKRLIVRAHRYEVTVDFPNQIDMKRYFAGVAIVPWVGRTLVQEFDWPVNKMVYIPNYVNSRYFRREKLEGAEFTLGIVGITPDLKRLDLALDLLERLRSVDLRYSLRVRGDLPTTHINWEKQPVQAEQWGSILRRLEQNPLLRNSVHFDTPGRDMAAWYQQIGVILSTSDIEGSHVALAEGIASGALPVARNWPGIETLWPKDFVFQNIDDAVKWVLRSRNVRWRTAQVQRFSGLRCLDQDRVLGAWWDLVNGRIEQAQSAFGPIDWNAPLYEGISS